MYSSDDGSEDANCAVLYLDLAPMAYVRPVRTDKGSGYGVYTVDGTQLAVFSSREAAYFAAKQHNLEPVLIH